LLSSSSQLDCGNPRIVGFYQRAMLLPGCSQCSTLSCRPSPAYDARHTRRRQVGSFHRLKASKRVQYRLMTIVSRSLNGTAPHYLAADLRRLSDMPSRRYVCGHSSLDHRSARCPPVAVLQTDRLLLLVLDYGTVRLSVCHQIFSCATYCHVRFRRELKTFQIKSNLLNAEYDTIR